MTGLILPAFLLLHFITGLIPLPFKGASPVFYALMKNAGIWVARRLNRETRAAGDLFLRGTLVTLIAAAGGVVRLTRALQRVLAVLVHLLMAAGCYRVVSGFLNTCGVELDEGVPGWPA